MLTSYLSKQAYAALRARAMKLSPPHPTYPLPFLPSDVKPVDGSLYTQCSNCNETLMIPPSLLRAHKRGVRCRRITEVIRMNAKGLFELGGKSVSKRAKWLQPYSTKGKFSEFFPEPIVSFVLWKFGTVVPNSVIEDSELFKFMGLNLQEQIAHLSGVLLAYEYAKEDDFDDKPFWYDLSG